MIHLGACFHWASEKPTLLTTQRKHAPPNLSSRFQTSPARQDRGHAAEPARRRSPELPSAPPSFAADRNADTESGSSPARPPGLDIGPMEGFEVHLALPTRWRLEADHRLDRLPRPRRTLVNLHALVGTRVARSADLVEQPLCRQPRIFRQALIDDLPVRIQLVGHRVTRPSRTRRQQACLMA